MPSSCVAPFSVGPNDQGQAPIAGAVFKREDEAVRVLMEMDGCYSSGWGTVRDGGKEDVWSARGSAWRVGCT